MGFRNRSARPFLDFTPMARSVSGLGAKRLRGKTFGEDVLQSSLGWAAFELSIQSAETLVLLVSILRSGTEAKAWCRVLAFAEEFGISVQFDPFALVERRGG